MPISVLPIGFLLFFVSLCIHVAIWRWWRPQNDILALFIIFLVLPVTAIPAILIFRVSGMFSPLNCTCTFRVLVSGLFLHFALSAAYIMSYPASQAVSPSLIIILIIARAMPIGCTQKEIESHFDDDILLNNRFQDLIDAKLAKEQNGALTLTTRGIVITRVFSFYRRLLGLQIGEG